ncbi:MAG: hypothetical protein HYZ69_03695 [Candidatus Colwellbacteria bacterium]|nr:hypothetical protein [Candidatus Colwellbacteria bacterium]
MVDSLFLMRVLLLIPVFYVVYWYIAGIPIVFGTFFALYKHQFRYLIYGVLVSIPVSYFGTVIYLLCCLTISIP